MKRKVLLSSLTPSFTLLTPVNSKHSALSFIEQDDKGIIFNIVDTAEQLDLPLDTAVEVDAQANTISFACKVEIDGKVKTISAEYKPSKLTESKLPLPLAYQFTFRIPEKIIVVAENEEEAYEAFVNELRDAAPDIEPVLVGKPKKV